VIIYLLLELEIYLLLEPETCKIMLDVADIPLGL
jgi:hypothetical protein